MNAIAFAVLAATPAVNEWAVLGACFALAVAVKFLPVVLQYVQQNGGDAPMELLARAFK